MNNWMFEFCSLLVFSIFYSLTNSKILEVMLLTLKNSRVLVVILLTLNNSKISVFISSCFCFFSFSTLLVFVSSDVFIVFFTLCVVTASATDLRERFLHSDIFYLTLLPAVFKASPRSGSSTLKLAVLHADP